MRRHLIAFTGAVLLASAGVALAQPQQGGNLGRDPGTVTVTDPGMTQGAGSFVAPTDPSYSDNGAPRAGAPAPDGGYAPIQHQHTRG